MMNMHTLISSSMYLTFDLFLHLCWEVQRILIHRGMMWKTNKIFNALLDIGGYYALMEIQS